MTPRQKGLAKKAPRDGIYSPPDRWVTNRRIAQIDAHIASVKASSTPHQPAEWEIQKAIREERDALRLRVAELEAQIDRMVDASLAAEKRSFPSGLGRPKRGRPRKVTR